MSAHSAGRPALSFLAAILLTACGQQAAEAPAPEPSATAPEVQRPVEEIATMTSAATVAAAAPFGLLRVAPATAADAGGLVLGHGRRTGGPDLVVAAGTGTGAVRWSSTPGRLVGVQADAGLVAEATSSGRVALYRFTAVPGEALVLTFDWRAAVPGELLPARGRRAVTGVLETPDGLQLHAAVRFDQAFVVQDAVSAPGRLELHFQPSAGVVQARVALSSVDLAAARDNLLELDHWNFERALEEVRDRWDQWLGRLAIAGEDAAAVAVRHAWYRVLSHYGDLTDRDGRFRAPDGSVRRVPGGRVLVGNLVLAREADTVVPLLALLAPEVSVGLAETVLLHHRLTGRFPVSTGWGFERTLKERPPTPQVLAMLAGLAARDLPGLEAQRLLPAMLKTTGPLGGASAPRNPNGLGYFAYDRVDGPTVSLTLEASEAQHALASVAAQLGNRAMAAEAAARSVLYRQLYEPQTGFFRARSSRLAWRSPFDPVAPSAVVRSDYRDGSPWGALWTPARFDIEGLLTLLGGRQVLADRLESYFSGAGGEAVPANPAGKATPGNLDHVPWLYAFSNRPRAGQPAIDQRLAEGVGSPSAAPDAAAWRIFASLGLFPVSPASGDYVLSRPAVTGAVMRVGDGELVIETAPSRGAGSPATLDDVPLTGPTVSHRRLAAGGLLIVYREE